MPTPESENRRGQIRKNRRTGCSGTSAQTGCLALALPDTTPSSTGGVFLHFWSHSWLNDSTRVPAIHRLDFRLARRLDLGPAASTVALKFENILHDEVTYKETNQMKRLLFLELDLSF